MDRVHLTSLAMALAFLCIALLIHGGVSEPVDEIETVNIERVKRKAPEDAAAPNAENDAKVNFISDDPYNRPTNWELDMYRLLAIGLFLAFAIGMYFVVWRLCSGPPA